MSDPRGLTPEGRDHLVDAITQQSHQYLRDEPRRPDPFMMDQVEVRCSIRINGETVIASQRVDAMAWSDPNLRDAVIRNVRQECALEVVKRFPPKVDIIT